MVVVIYGTLAIAAWLMLRALTTLGWLLGLGLDRPRRKHAPKPAAPAQQVDDLDDPGFRAFLANLDENGRRKDASSEPDWS